MKKQMVEVVTIAAALFFLSISALALNAEARAGGGRSSGGSRSYSRPASPSPQQSQPRQQVAPAPAPAPVQQPGGGGFMRSMAGGMMGGLLGGMLFSSFAGAGTGGGMGGSGIGLFEILLLAGGGYLIFRYFKKKRAASSAPLSGQDGSVFPLSSTKQSHEPLTGGVETGLAYIRQMDPSFDVGRFNDLAMDIFFKIQGAWMSRDLAPVAGLLSDEMKEIFQRDLNQLLRNKQVNRLENIAVRQVESAEVWQEAGQDYVTVSIYANLLDYTVDDLSGAVVSGSKTEPVKFEEFWTFTRPVGNNPWQLSAINQK